MRGRARVDHGGRRLGARLAGEQREGDHRWRAERPARGRVQSRGRPHRHRRSPKQPRSHVDLGRLYDTRSGTSERLARRAEWRAAVTSLAFDPAGGLLITTAWDQPTRIWSTRTGKLVYELASSSTGQGSEEAVLYAKFSPDGRRVVTAARDGKARSGSCRSPRSQPPRFCIAMARAACRCRAAGGPAEPSADADGKVSTEQR